MIIGLIPGAMKPYHQGHHFLVDAALAECEKVIVYTTEKDRSGISGKNMKLVWEKIIIPNMGQNKFSKLSIEFVTSPVGSVYELLEEEEINPTEHTYRVYGGAEDALRFSYSYTRNRFPRSAGRFVNVAEESHENFYRGKGKSPNVKGEWVRTAIENKDINKFVSCLPGFLKPHGREYLDILIS